MFIKFLYYRFYLVKLYIFLIYSTQSITSEIIIEFKLNKKIRKAYLESSNLINKKLTQVFLKNIHNKNTNYIWFDKNIRIIPLNKKKINPVIFLINNNKNFIEYINETCINHYKLKNIKLYYSYLQYQGKENIFQYFFNSHIFTFAAVNSLYPLKILFEKKQMALFKNFTIKNLYIIFIIIEFIIALIMILYCYFIKPHLLILLNSLYNYLLIGFSFILIIYFIFHYFIYEYIINKLTNNLYQLPFLIILCFINIILILFIQNYNLHLGKIYYIVFQQHNEKNLQILSLFFTIDKLEKKFLNRLKRLHI